MDPTDALADTLGFTNPFTRGQLYEGLQRWPSLSAATRRCVVFRSLAAARKKAPTSSPAWEQLTENVKALEPLLRAPSAAESESYDQVCFRGSPWGELNSIPFALVILALYKTWVVPAFGALLPLLTWILPYLFLTSVSGIPMSFGEYSKILWQMWNGQFGPGSQTAPPQNAALQLKQMLQNAWTLFTIGQAIWQPIQQARHFSHLDTSCRTLGEVILNVKGIAAQTYADWGTWMPRWIQRWMDLCPSDPRQAFAFVVETPHWLPHLLRGLGRFEVLWTLAGRKDVCAAQFVGGDKPVLMLRDFGDPLIAPEKRILSSVRMGTRSGGNHAILTGPNRGGKSSLMRGILLNVRLAHAFGAAFAGKAQMSRFTWIADGLRLDDRPGKLSMFEREVCFAQAILTPRPGLGLCLYDELFHSTNPPDAARTSEVFCDALWKRDDCLSLVSTHVYSLARGAPESVKKVCVAAWKGEGEGEYTFSYTLQRGICEVSSVELLLQQHGLTGKPRPRPAAATNLLPSDQK